MFRPPRVTVAFLFAVVVMVPLVRIQDPAQSDLRQWKIAFDSFRSGTQEIYVMDPDGANQQRLTRTPGKGEGSWRPCWSPDGTRIAFDSNREGNWEIYVMDVEGSNVQRLTHTPGKESGNPAWSPDGKKIAFGSTRDGKSKNWKDNREIYVMDAHGSNVQRLTFNQAWDAHPYW